MLSHDTDKNICGGCWSKSLFRSKSVYVELYHSACNLRTIDFLTLTGPITTTTTLPHGPQFPSEI